MSKLQFEGTEKKLEIAVDTEFPSLRSLPRQFWEDVVERSRAKVISVISNEKCDAYLLSESSLFVFDDFLTMITCGNTSLVEAALEITNTIPVSRMSQLFYERKNPIFPQWQDSHFNDDVKRISEIVPGKAFRFGDLSEHHICLFHMKSDAEANPEDATLEILMHDIDDSAKKLFFHGDDRTLKDIKEKSDIARIFDGFEIDEYLFAPCGYSMNAIKDGSYYTFHVTPEDEGSYVSFETNNTFNEPLSKTIQRVVDIFRPKSYDVVCFQLEEVPEALPGYHAKRKVRKRLENGYEVSFFNFFKIDNSITSPTQIKF